MGKKKKSFFRERTKREMLDDRIRYISLDNPDLVSAILEIGRTLAIGDPHVHSNDQSRKLMKHGRELYLWRFGSIREAVEAIERGRDPLIYRREAVNRFCEKPFNPFYSMAFRLGRKSKRRFSVIEILEGHRIIAYANQVVAPIEIEGDFTDSKRVEREGATFVCRVPSRREKHLRYPIKMVGVSWEDNPSKLAINSLLASTHECERKLWNVRFTYLHDVEGSEVLDFCAHDIAAYLSIINHYWSLHKHMLRSKADIVPLQVCPFPLQTPLSIEFYLKVCNHVLFYDEERKGKDKLRKPYMAEKQDLQTRLIHQFGHDDTMFVRASEHGKLRDLDWSPKI